MLGVGVGSLPDGGAGDGRLLPASPVLRLLVGLLGAGVAVASMRRYSAAIYDALIVRMTAKWYAAVLSRLPPRASVLDVGIGTATALARNAAELRQRQLSIVGIDYEAAYVRKAEAVLRSLGLWGELGPQGVGAGSCHVLELSVYDAALEALCPPAKFDAAYFSGSLTLMPDPPEALRRVAALVKPGGSVFVTQTFQRHYSPVSAFVKPWLRYLTTVDFGQVTYRNEVDRIIEKAGPSLQLIEASPIPGSLDNTWQVATLLVLRVTG